MICISKEIVITVTGKRIPHNMDGDDIIWGNKTPHFNEGISTFIRSRPGNTSTEISGLESNLFVVKTKMTTPYYLESKSKIFKRIIS